MVASVTRKLIVSPTPFNTDMLWIYAVCGIARSSLSMLTPINVAVPSKGTIQIFFVMSSVFAILSLLCGNVTSPVLANSIFIVSFVRYSFPIDSFCQWGMKISLKFVYDCCRNHIYYIYPLLWNVFE